MKQIAIKGSEEYGDAVIKTLIALTGCKLGLAHTGINDALWYFNDTNNVINCHNELENYNNFDGDYYNSPFDPILVNMLLDVKSKEDKCTVIPGGGCVNYEPKVPALYNKCIKGNGTIDYGKRIIKHLEEHGGVNNGWEGCNHSYYFITPKGNIECSEYNIPEGYTELVLEEDKFVPKVGDWIWSTAMGHCQDEGRVRLVTIWQKNNKAYTTGNSGPRATSKDVRLATDKEIVDMFIQLARDRGFVDGYDCISTPGTNNIQYIESELKFYRKHNQLSCRGFWIHTVESNKWVEPVVVPTTLFGYNVERCTEFGRQSSIKIGCEYVKLEWVETLITLAKADGCDTIAFDNKTEKVSNIELVINSLK